MRQARAPSPFGSAIRESASSSRSRLEGVSSDHPVSSKGRSGDTRATARLKTARGHHERSSGARSAGYFGNGNVRDETDSFVSSALAKPARPSQPACARRVWSGSRRGTFCFRRPRANALKRAAAASGVRCATSAADAVRGADMVFRRHRGVERRGGASVKPHVAGRPFFSTSIRCRPGANGRPQLLGDAARYVDVGVIAPIHPARHQTPMLLAGPDAEALAPTLGALGMRLRVAGAEIGAAAAIKMVRSVIIKGIEALTLECFLAASRAGVVDEVAASMKTIIPASTGRRWSPTTSNAWRATASAAPPRWNRSPKRCGNSASNR